VHGIEDKLYSAVLGVPELRVGAGKAVLISEEGAQEQVFSAGEVLSIHGQTGEVFDGPRKVISIKNGEAKPV